MWSRPILQSCGCDRKRVSLGEVRLSVIASPGALNLDKLAGSNAKDLTERIQRLCGHGFNLSAAFDQTIERTLRKTTARSFGDLVRGPTTFVMAPRPMACASMGCEMCVEERDHARLEFTEDRGAVYAWWIVAEKRYLLGSRVAA